MKKIMLMVVAAVASFSANAYTVTARAVGALDTAMGSVEIKQGDNVVANGSDLTGSVTITATAKDANRPFVKWLGSGITDEQRTSATLTIENLASDVNIVPVFEGMWLYDDLNTTDKTGTLTEIRNDTTAGWQLNVTNANSTAFTCTLGENDTAKIANGIRRVSVAYNPGEGELDISTPIVDADGNLWQITEWRNRCLAMHKASTSVLTNEAIFGECATLGFAQKIIVPKTLTKFNGAPFNADCTGLKDLIINCPIATGEVGANFFGRVRDLTNLVVKVPEVTKLNDVNFSASTALSSGKICVDEWDFSSVEQIGNWMGGDNPNQGVGTFHGVKVKGSLRFPSVKNICIRTFYGFQTDGDLELGSGGTIERIRCFAFGGDFKVNRLILGGDAGWKIGGEVVSLKGVKEVVFTTDNLPTLNSGEMFENKTEKVEAENKMFCGDTAEKTVCFYVPKSYTWQRAIGKENKDESGKHLMKAGNFLGTDYDQYVNMGASLVDVGYLIPYSVKVADPRYGDKINVYVDGEQVLDEGVEISGSVTNGTVLRFEAVCKAGNVAHWKALNWGWKSDNVEETFTVTSDAKFGNVVKPIEIGLWSRHPWEFLPATEAYPTNRITDGIWTLNVCRVNSNVDKISETSKNLAIGLSLDSDVGNAFTGEGSGVLDLNGTIKDSGNNEYKIISFLRKCMTPSGVAPFTALVYPESFVKFQGQLFNVDSSRHTNLKTVIFDVPNMANKWASYTMSGLKSVECLYVAMPNSTDITAGGVLPTESPLNETDRSVWDFSSITSISNGTISAVKERSRYVNNREVLKFPIIRNIGKTNADPTKESAVMSNMGVWGIELGGDVCHKDDTATTLTVIGQDFKNSPELKSLKFGAYSNFVFNANAFTGCPNIEEITFTGKCLMTEDETRTLLDTILISVPAKSDTQKIQTVIRASMNIGWDKIKSDFLTDDDGAEKADAEVLSSWLDDGERIVGVYVTANNERKAWIVHKANEEYDPVGTIFIIR